MKLRTIVKMRHHMREILPLIASLLFSASNGSAAPAPNPEDVSALEPEPVESTLFLKVPQAKRPWGVVFDDNGFMYLAGNNFDIDKVTPQGRVTRIATMPSEFVGPGMAFDQNRNLLIADGRYILKINPTGRISALVTNFTRALDLQIDSGGNILAADDIEGKVYCLTPQMERKVVIDRHINPPMWFALTSIAIDRKRENAYLAEMISGKIIRYPLNGDGTVGPPEEIANNIVGLRFLAVDDEGIVYANTHFPVLIRIDKNKKQRRFFVDQMEDPAGMAFGRRGFGSKVLYISNRYGVTTVNTASISNREPDPKTNTNP